MTNATDVEPRPWPIHNSTLAARLGELAILWLAEPGWIAIEYVYLYTRLAARAAASQLDHTEDR